jgi:hypothetical protein
MRLLRLLPALPLLVGLTTVGTITAVGPSAVGCASAAPAHHAALIIEHGNGTVVARCVSFDGDSIPGEQLLQLARAQWGLEYATATYSGGTGDAVCQIDYEPAQYPSGCWTASSPYWAMYVSRGGGGWSPSNLGVSSQTFRDGDAEGFRYEGQSAYLTPSSPAGICPAPTPPPTPAATPRSTPRPTAPAPARHPPAATATPGPVAVGPVANPPGGATAPSSATPDVVVVAGSSGSRRASSFIPGSGALAASALAAALVALLIVQVIRQRGRRHPASPRQ